MSPLNVVVVGHGMVGARFAEEVRRHDPDGRRVRLTFLAAEPRPAYNRVLLPNLLSGVMKEEDFAATVVAGLPVLTGQSRNTPNGSVLHPDAPMTLRLRTTVVGIDPVTRTVLVRSAAAAGPPLRSTRDRARQGARAADGGRTRSEAVPSEAVPLEAVSAGTGPIDAGPDGTGAIEAAAAEAGPTEAALTEPGLIDPGFIDAGFIKAGSIEAGAIERIGYDVLVLATGAQPVIPPLPGVLAGEEDSFGPRSGLGADHRARRAADHRAVPGPDRAADPGADRSGDHRAGLGGFPLPAAGVGDAGNGAGGREARSRSDDRLCADVAALHSLTDARHIAAFAQAARRTGGRVAVLGGGVLGLEAARALAARGTGVTVVHRGGHLMDRQLDAAAGRVLTDAMRRTGVDVSLGRGAARWESGRGLWLADGQLVKASGLVLCTGTRPRVELARDAGLRLAESGAVAVDDTLATSVQGIYAIGDCAGHPGAAGGLVQPGWEQAAVLASRLAGVSPKARYRGSGAVTRLKAAGIELTAAGTSLPEPGADQDLEVLRFEDPARERYGKLVLADDRVVGAIMIGLPDAAAGIVQLYDRNAPAPADRLALLLGRALPPEAGSGATGPAALPDYAVVCRCNMVTKGQLRDAWYGGACGRAALSAATRAATGCGTCGDDLDAVAAWLAETDPSQTGTQDAALGRPTDTQDHPRGASGQHGDQEKHSGQESGQSADPQEADPQEKEAALR